MATVFRDDHGLLGDLRHDAWLQPAPAPVTATAVTR